MLQDDFATNPIRYQGVEYDCWEHAQWREFLRLLGQRVKYKPIQFLIEVPTTDRYNIGSQPSIERFDPTFHVAGVGYIHCSDKPPLAYTLRCAERLADDKEEAVYVIEGVPETPTVRYPTNQATACYGQCPPKPGYRMLHDGRRFRFGRPSVVADIMAPKILSAASYVEQMRLGSEAVRDHRS